VVLSNLLAALHETEVVMLGFEPEGSGLLCRRGQVCLV
jgi:hypothetical protein